MNEVKKRKGGFGWFFLFFSLATFLLVFAIATGMVGGKTVYKEYPEKYDFEVVPL